MKELDVLLTRFIDANQAALERGAWPAFERLLASEDDVLWARLQSPPTGAGDEAELLGAIRSGHAADD
jgi:succinate dehydrogenase flavin-adding protein (antitoxin of CptAB toxin-antitoxin module)